MEFEFRPTLLVWYPFEIDTGLRFALVTIQQWHAGFIGAFCFLSIDIFIFSVLMMLIMLFTYISNELKGMTISGGKNDLVKLKLLVEVHRKSLELADLNNRVFSITILVNFIFSTALICLTTFRATSTGMPVAELGRYMVFLAQQISQVGTICYLGEVLMDSVSNSILLSQKLYLEYFQSEKVADAAYAQDWMSASLKYQKNLLFTIMRAHTPSILVAKPIGIVSMSVFSKILSSSYQLFVCIRHTVQA